MKSKKILTISIIAIIILLLVLFVLLYITNRTEKNNINIEEDIQDVEEIENDENYNYISNDEENLNISRVKDNATFYTIENCIKKFEAYVNLNYKEQVNELGQPSIAAEYGISNDAQKKEAVLMLLDKEYINQNNITNENIYNFINESMNDNVKVEALRINKLVDVNEDVKGYSVYAKKTTKQNIAYTYYIVKVTDENVFCIYPILNSKYKDLDEINIKNETEKINKNNRNTFVSATINNGQIAARYFQEYKTMLLNNYKDAYVKLNNEYVSKRFENIKGFYDYIQNSKNKIQLMQIYRYEYKEKNDYNEYIARDQYNNIYLFYETAPKEYTVMLDDYTIETEEYKKEYAEATDESKINTNISKFIKMLNNGDYKQSYAVLNNTFKSKNFNSQDKFKNYIKSKVFDVNNVDFVDYTINGENHISQIRLSDATGKSKQSVTMNIIMKLNEGTNFEMSFSFK